MVQETKTSDTTKFFISVSPHIRDRRNVSNIMWAVILALLPATGCSIYFFRWRAVVLILTCILTCVITEAVCLKLRRKRLSVSDSSAVLTGLLLAMVLPPGLPVWAAVIGAVAAIVLGKQIFGGLGCNIFNPALVGRAFLMAAFPVYMTTWVKPFSLDAVTTATPLGLMKFEHISTPAMQLFLGNVPGSLGETSALALIVGGLYLLIRRYMDWRIPLSYLGTVVVFGGILWLINPQVYPSVGFHLLSGGLMLGALFMATDPVTSPVTKKGRWIFGLGAGILVIIIRIWGGLPEGVMYSILLMNAVTPLINRYTKPKPFGYIKRKD